VAHAVKADEPANPVPVGLLRAAAVVPRADRVAYPIDQAPLIPSVLLRNGFRR
jgi:hypothetical protein